MFRGLFSAFMVDTWLAATVVAVVAGLVGFFVVLRGATFAAHAIPQGAFTGAAGAALVGGGTLVGIGAFALLSVAVIARWGRRGRNDVVIALSLVGVLGLGSLFLSLSSQYSQQTFGLLFGEPLAVSASYLWPMAGVGATCAALVLSVWRPLMLCSVAPDLAAAQGIKAERVELWFLLAVGAATTLALPVVGALLVFSLMIGPPAAARSLSDRPSTAIAVSIALSLLTAWVAVALAYGTNWPVGFFVGALAVAWYAAGRGTTAWRRRLAPTAVGSAS